MENEVTQCMKAWLRQGRWGWAAQPDCADGIPAARLPANRPWQPSVRAAHPAHPLASIAACFTCLLLPLRRCAAHDAACPAVLQVRTTLGPRGMDKLMHTERAVTVSNDGERGSSECDGQQRAGTAFLQQSASLPCSAT